MKLRCGKQVEGFIETLSLQDARWYIAHIGIDKVANLIMIGTPNAGSPAALWDFTGCPFGSDGDLFPGSTATRVVDRPQSTHYYTIAGSWLPDNACWIGFWVTDGGSCISWQCSV